MKYQYKAILKQGPYAVCPDCIVLDRHIRERPDDIDRIEVILEDHPDYLEGNATIMKLLEQTFQKFRGEKR